MPMCIVLLGIRYVDMFRETYWI